jgi:hypothetical protein
MESLFARATRVDALSYPLPSGDVIQMRRLCVHFGRATPPHLKPGTLLPTYTSKPLVSFQGAAMFGELALLRWLEVDGWVGVWVDTGHGRKLWREMPNRGDPVTLPPAQQAFHDQIVVENGGRSGGFFDVMAWRGRHTIFVEYKGADERAPKNESAWISAALRAGVSKNDLLIVRNQ